MGQYSVYIRQYLQENNLTEQKLNNIELVLHVWTLSVILPVSETHSNFSWAFNAFVRIWHACLWNDHEKMKHEFEIKQ